MIAESAGPVDNHAESLNLSVLYHQYDELVLWVLPARGPQNYHKVFAASAMELFHLKEGFKCLVFRSGHMSVFECDLAHELTQLINTKEHVSFTQRLCY